MNNFGLWVVDRWNSLSDDARDVDKLAVFKKKLGKAIQSENQRWQERWRSAGENQKWNETKRANHQMSRMFIMPWGVSLELPPKYTQVYAVWMVFLWGPLPYC
jgi:hypothetical protein